MLVEPVSSVNESPKNLVVPGAKIGVGYLESFAHACKEP
jgi:hypothetical protein